MPFSRVFKRYFHHGRHFPSSEYIKNTRKAENNTIEMSQLFQDIAQFERFTDPNLFKYAFNVIQNWQMDALQFYSMVLIFC